MAERKAPRRTNRVAVDVTLAGLREDLTDEHAALVQLLRSLADAVDAEPGNASLWREYRGAISDLAGIARSATDDGFARLLDRLRTPVGDSAN